MHTSISTNSQQVSVDASGYNFFFICIEEFNSTLLLSYALPGQISSFSDCLSAVLCHKATIIMEYWWKGSIYTAVPPTSASEVVGQHNKTEGIAFRIALVLHFLQWWVLEISVPKNLAVNSVPFLLNSFFTQDQSRYFKSHRNYLKICATKEPVGTVYFSLWFK